LGTSAWHIAGQAGYNNYRGGIDEFYIFPKILNATEVSRLYTQTVSPNSMLMNYTGIFDITTRKWSSLGGISLLNNGLNAVCRTIKYDNSNNKVYVGGDFTVTRDKRQFDFSINYIAAYDPSTNLWNAFGEYINNGTNGQINAYAYDSCKNIVYCGGTFTQVYDVSNIVLYANNIAAWDMTKRVWTTIGSTTLTSAIVQNGLDSSCNALAMDSSSQILYVGGNFKRVSDLSAADQSANYVAAWNVNTQRWQKLGSIAAIDSSKNGLNALCRTMVYDNNNKFVYVGGDFTQTTDTRGLFTMNYVAIWNTQTSVWSNAFGSYGSTSGSNGTNGTIFGYAIDNVNQLVYVCGLFSIVFDSVNISQPANNVAVWNIIGKYWYILGSNTYNGTNGQCNAISLDTSNQVLYVGGNFTTVSDISNVGKSANYIAKWNINMQRWSQLGTPVSNGLTALCRALTYDASNQKIYVGGDFTTVKDARNYTGFTSFAFKYAAAWNTQQSKWEGLGAYAMNGLNGTTPMVNAYVYDSCKNVIYCGGTFNKAYDQSNVQISANNVVGWDVANKYWFSLGNNASNGVNLDVNSLAIDSSRQILYVGGMFTTASDTSNVGLSTKLIASWNINTQRWSPLGIGANNGLAGTSGVCSALLYDNSNNNLYVGGTFTSASDISNTSLAVNNVAYWDISASRWNILKTSQQTAANNGVVSTQIFSFALDNSNNYLYIGGFNAQAQGVTPTIGSHIIALNRNTNLWESVGINGSSQQGTNWLIRQMILDTSNSWLYICGGFDIVYDVTALPTTLAVITAWLVEPPLKYIVGTDVYALPPDPIFMPVTVSPVITAVPVAPLPDVPLT
jgi:hypothetical protein